MLNITQDEITTILNILETYTLLSKEVELATDNIENIIIKPLMSVNNIFSPKHKGWSSYRQGTTKIILFPKNKNYVIKIPKNGRRFYNRLSLSEKKFFYFTMERKFDYTKEDYGRGWDYCKEEAQIVQEAKELNLNEYFAETLYLGDVRGYPIYAQEKVTVMTDRYELDEDEDYDSIYDETAGLLDSYEGSDNSDSSYYSSEYDDEDNNVLPLNWSLVFVKKYGVDALKSLIEFIQDMGINDIHSDNVGFIDGNPILLDYSGYYE